MRDDLVFMREAVAEARKGLAEGEVPVGAVAVRDGRIVARGHNMRFSQSDITAHAEMTCLRELSARSGPEFDLSDVTVFSTLEPCAMCSGAMIHYRVGRCVWGERDLLLGAAGSAMSILNESAVVTEGGALRSECRAPLLEFFEQQLGSPSCEWKDIRLPEA